jgi:hypothetical protein
MAIKIIQESGDWLVDGCGIINIPADKELRDKKLHTTNVYVEFKFG